MSPSASKLLKENKENSIDKTEESELEVWETEDTQIIIMKECGTHENEGKKRDRNRGKKRNRNRGKAVIKKELIQLA